MTKEGNKTITKSDKTNSDAAAATTGAAESEAKPTVKVCKYNDSYGLCW